MTIPTNILHVELVNLISAKYLSQIWICVTIFFEHSYIRQKRFPKPIKEVRLCQFVEQNLRAFLNGIIHWTTVNYCIVSRYICKVNFFHRSNKDSNVTIFECCRHSVLLLVNLVIHVCGQNASMSNLLEILKMLSCASACMISGQSIYYLLFVTYVYVSIYIGLWLWFEILEERNDPNNWQL